MEEKEADNERDLTPYEIVEVRQVFGSYARSEFVQDEYGRVEEVSKMPLKDLECCLFDLGVELTECETAALYRALSDDPNGDVEFKKFLEAIKHLYMTDYSEEDLKNIFSLMDVKDNGYLTAKDIKRVYTTAIGSLTDEELDDVFKEVDMDADGKISLDEYLYFFSMTSD